MLRAKFLVAILKEKLDLQSKETLTSRLIDRPIRPLFPEDFKNEVQIFCTVLSADKNINPDIASLIGASAALSISGVPFQGPLGGSQSRVY